MFASAGAQAQDGHSETADISIEATDESYASVTDGEIEFHFEGLNQDATTTIDDVFSIEVTGDQPRTVWFDEPSGVTFYEGDDRTATIDGDNPLRIAAGQSASIGAEVDTRETTDDEPTVTIYTNVDDGLSSNVRMTYAGVDVGLEPGAQATGGPDATGDEGSETDGQFTVQSGVEFDVVGTFQYELIEEESESAPSFLSNDAGTASGFASSPADSPVTPLSNGESETFIAELSIDGIVRDTTRITLEPGGEREVRFSTSIDEPGTYDVTVNGHHAGSVTVEETNEIFTINNMSFTQDHGLLAIPLFGTLLVLVTPPGRRASRELLSMVSNRITSEIPSRNRRHK
ncbi:hypothetical protein OB905_10445 [Halobacteria archaeon AArc-dxtr1]|nr:hypothetical protein [Halobacteria archaeon AArc-dxtr1]